ncbi:MAG TPA: helix-turn-helix transcriptional regulator [Vicinamibacterales bacterium]|jgi:transcriptional regulator with XRE-family HTH domain
MSEREAFGPNLRRLRVQRGISLESIAGATKVHTDLWAGLERNDFSRWPAGIYARAYVRAYAVEVGVDPDATVDEFCRLFPNGDRRVVRVVRQQAAMMGHDLRWKDDLVGSVTDEKRSTRPSEGQDLPAVSVTRTGRIVAAVLDVSASIGVAAAIATLMPLRWSVSIAVSALAYHAVSLIALGSTPAVWAIETYLANRHPTTSRAGTLRFLRLLHRSETSRS